MRELFHPHLSREVTSAFINACTNQSRWPHRPDYLLRLREVPTSLTTPSSGPPLGRSKFLLRVSWWGSILCKSLSRKAISSTLRSHAHLNSDELCRNGALITAYPAVIGAEACGVVIETGPDCVKFQQGDLIYGIVRVGVNDYAPFQETFLADEDLFFKKADNISKGEAAGVGAGIIVRFSANGLTASNRARRRHLESSREAN